MFETYQPVITIEVTDKVYWIMEYYRLEQEYMALDKKYKELYETTIPK